MISYNLLRPLLFKMDPEDAHNLAIKYLKFFPNLSTIFTENIEYPNLKTEICGIKLSSPIGLAAGFDKNAESLIALSKFGFGFVEAGTVTPLAQNGNEKPRLFRLEEDEAIINRFGFNNLGSEVFLQNIQNSKNRILCPFGVNIGKNKDSIDAFADYDLLLEKFYNIAPYITINISSPNTKNLRDLQNQDQLENFLLKVSDKVSSLTAQYNKKTPIFLKIAPDLDFDQQKSMANVILQSKVISALIISNTTISRPQNLKSKYTNQAGGLSGKPLFDISNQVLRNFYNFTEGKIPLIGVGGISSAEDIYQKIRFGASAVQIYSTFIYQGFGVVESLKYELSEMLKQNSYRDIREIVGLDA